MNMKKMMLAVAATLAGSVMADVSVEDVKCTQRYPWNGLVDIEYTIACDDPEAEIYVNPVGFNGDTGLTVFPTHFTGDGATNTVKVGKHKMVWDARADMGLFASKNFQIKIYAGKTLAPYVVVDLSSGPDGEHFPIRYSLAGPDISDDTCRTTELWLRLIPPGTFMMGSPADELGRSDNEDLHKVTITQPFYIGVFEVTNEQWYRVTGNKSSYANMGYEGYPATHKNWEDLRGKVYDDYHHYTHNPTLGVDYFLPSDMRVNNETFLGRIRAKTDVNGFDLPTEAQWEYACKLGTSTSLNNGRNLTGIGGCSNLSGLGRYYVNGSQGVPNWYEPNHATSKVGAYLPNAFGLYDMHGNVAEICRDNWKDHTGKSNVTDPCYSGTNEGRGIQGFNAVVRGGDWKSFASRCRSAAREAASGDSERFGFRISCPGNLQK